MEDPHRGWRSFFASCKDLVTGIPFILEASLTWNPHIGFRHDDLLFHVMRACWESKRVLEHAPLVHPPLGMLEPYIEGDLFKTDPFYIVRWTLEDGSG